MNYLPRGISPELLVSQVKNTMPYLFDPDFKEDVFDALIPVRVLREAAQTLGKKLDHFEYYRLCLSSHYLTCGTPVPTDVDHQIRHKLWPAHLPVKTALQMADLILESRSWNFIPLSPRWINGASSGSWEKEAVSGHLGEWFTVAAGAYCALQRYADLPAKEKRQHLLDSIADEVRRHSEIFGLLWRAYDGLSCLKASSIIAHNFGDLDRVMDLWDLSVADPLRLHFYKLAAVPFDSEGKLRYLGRLWVAGELYKSPIEGSSLALENHRHFALRKPRCLRKNREFLVPIGPFFDDWGRRIARGLASSQGSPSENTFEMITALLYGWERNPKTVGYGRALRSILEEHPDLKLEGPAKVGHWRAILNRKREDFENTWSEKAIQLMEDIPSRA